MNGHAISEALLLGLATGPVCLATCGPVVAPWLLAQPQGITRQWRPMGLFLTARLMGYMAFAVVTWLAGAAVPRAWETHRWPMALVNLLLAAAMVAWALGWPRRKCGKAERNTLVQIDQPVRSRRSSALLLGFLTGINFCPPFLAAGVRAAQLNHLAAALVFFAVFFLGTVVWFAPMAALGLVRRSSAVVAVARMTALLLALWYAGTGLMILAREAFHG